MNAIILDIQKQYSFYTTYSLETRNSSQEKLSEEELQSIANLEDLRDMLIDYRDEEKEKEQEPSERDQSIISLPNVYISPGITSTTGTQVAQVTKVIIEFNLLSDGGKRGYSAKNLKTIKLVPSVKVTQNT